MRRITPWAILLIAALLLLAAPVAASDTYSETFESGENRYFDYTIPAVGSGNVYLEAYLYTYDITQISGLESFVWHSGTIPISRYSNLPSEPWEVGDITVSVGGYVVGSGRIETYKQFDSSGNVIALEQFFIFDEWDIGTLTGAQTLTISFDSTFHKITTGALYPQGWMANPSYFPNYQAPDNIIVIKSTGPSNGYNVFGGYYSVHTNSVWKNTISIEEAGGYTYISLDRYDYASKFIFNGYAHTYSTIMDYGDINLQYPGTESPATFSVQDPTLRWFNRTYGDGGIIASDFTLTLSPTTAAVGDSVTATLTPDADAPRYSEIAWTVTDPDGNTDIELYTKPSPDYTSWTKYNKTSRTFEASTESAAHNLVFSPTGPGAWAVSAVVRDNQPPSTGAALASVSAPCQVERKAGNVDVVISTYDGAYSSAHYLSGVALTVWDLSRNATVIYDSSGDYILGSSGTYNGLVTISAPLGDEIRIKAEKSGYIASDFNTFVQPTALPLNQMPISITLMPAATPAPDQVYASFTVRSARGSPISGAAVVAGGHLASTDSNGYARVAIPYNETVAYTVSASGYGSISGYILPATSNTALTVTLYVASTTTPATTAPDGSSTPPARDPGDVIDSGVSIVLEFFEILVFMGCIATLAGFAALMGGRRR